jgi:hypothetical protein
MWLAGPWHWLKEANNSEIEGSVQEECAGKGNLAVEASTRHRMQHEHVCWNDHIIKTKVDCYSSSNERPHSQDQSGLLQLI